LKRKNRSLAVMQGEKDYFHKDQDKLLLSSSSLKEISLKLKDENTPIL